MKNKNNVTSFISLIQEERKKHSPIKTNRAKSPVLIIGDDKIEPNEDGFSPKIINNKSQNRREAWTENKSKIKELSLLKMIGCCYKREILLYREDRQIER